MISKIERKVFKNILGSHYTDNVTEVLIANKIKDTAGKTHSPQMVRQVFNGTRNHKEIELAIIDAVKIEKKKAAILKRKKSKLLKSA
jgi:hypothetical protein